MLALAVPLVYFSQLHCRDYRYLTLFIPFVALFTGYGIKQVIGKSDKMFKIALILVLSISLFSGTLYFIENENNKYDDVSMNYFTYLQDKDTKGEIWTANPVISFFTDSKIHKIYYPVYDAGISMTFNDYLEKNSDKIDNPSLNLLKSAISVFRNVKKNDKPNFILIITDQMRGDALSSAISFNARTPNLDKLAEEGVLNAVRKDQTLAKGVNIYSGKTTYKAVAEALDLEYTPLDSMI